MKDVTFACRRDLCNTVEPTKGSGVQNSIAVALSELAIVDGPIERVTPFIPGRYCFGSVLNLSFPDQSRYSLPLCIRRSIASLVILPSGESADNARITSSGSTGVLASQSVFSTASKSCAMMPLQVRRV